MRWVLVLGLLGVTSAGAQTPPPSIKAPKTLTRSIPALYWARLSSVISKRMRPFPKGLSAQVRLYLDDDGAITQMVLLRPSGVDLFDRMLERLLADHAPTAQLRLPVAKDEKMRVSAREQGVSVVIRSRMQTAQERTDAAARKKARGAKPRTRRINLPADINQLKPSKPE